MLVPFSVAGETKSKASPEVEDVNGGTKSAAPGVVILLVAGDAMPASSFAGSEVPPRPLSIYLARATELSLL